MIKKEVMSYVFEERRIQHRIGRGRNYLVYQILRGGEYVNVDAYSIGRPYSIEEKEKVVAYAEEMWSIGQPYMEHYYADILSTDVIVDDRNKLRFSSSHLYMDVIYIKSKKETFLRLSESDRLVHVGPVSFSSTDVVVMRKEALEYANNCLDLDFFYAI